MTADEFNRLVPVGTRVIAYPGVRPEDPAKELCTRLETRTTSEAWMLGGHTAVVLVAGYAGGIACSHVDVTAGGAA